jgi:DNA-binding transcriptional LysR family regulator
MTDKFEDIRTFIAVVQAKGFAGAAARMGLAKSAISRRVSDLEDRLGTRLLHRTTREVRLTESGAGFYDRSIKLLADLGYSDSALNWLVGPCGMSAASAAQRC